MKLAGKERIRGKPMPRERFTGKQGNFRKNALRLAQGRKLIRGGEKILDAGD